MSGRNGEDFLDGFRVLDLSGNLAGTYTARLLADVGALVERPEGAAFTLGDPGTRHEPMAEQAYLATLRRGWSWITRGDVDAASARADVIVVDESGVFIDPVEFVRTRPDAVVVSLTDFGLGGPRGGQRSASAVRQALSGSTFWRGAPGDAPVMAGGEVEQFLAGTYAATFVVAALRRASRGGGGELLDVSTLEAANLGLTTFGVTHSSLSGHLGDKFPRRSVQVPAIEKTSDGWIGLCAISARQRQDLMYVIGRPDLAEGEGVAYAGADTPRADEMREAVAQWASSVTTEEAADLAAAIRVPVSLVGSGDTLLANEQVAHRQSLIEVDGELRLAAPFQFTRGPVAEPVRRGAPSADRPLDGWKVVDLTAWWAGPVATQVLAQLGADVIKVESGVRPDGMRYSFVDDPSREQWWEFGPVYFGVNSDKRGIALDITSVEGIRVLNDLLLDADLLVENFTPRVLGSLGIDWETLREKNPRLVTVRLSAFGNDGPWRDRSGFAQTIEQASGMSWVTGHPDRAPLSPRGVCDPLAGLHAAFVAVAARFWGEGSGIGGTAELAMLDIAVRATSAQVARTSVDGEVPGRLGNADAHVVPQGVVATQDDDGWVLVRVEDQSQWNGLATALGRSDWIDLDRGQRRAREPELLQAIGQWAAVLDRDEAVRALTDAGVVVAPVLAAGEFPDLDQVVQRQFFTVLDHPVAGRHPVPGPPVSSSVRRAPWVQRPAPVLGQHTDEVLVEWTGASPERLAELRRSGVTGDSPVALTTT